MESIIKESTNLYHEIDDCITNLIKARLDKDIDKENEAICCMESLLVSTMQNISWLVGELKGSSNIKWQTGEPKESGYYLVILLGGKVRITEFYKYKVADKEYWDCNPYDILRIEAWCKLSDIKPYKEKIK